MTLRADLDAIEQRATFTTAPCSYCSHPSQADLPRLVQGLRLCMEALEDMATGRDVFPGLYVSAAQRVLAALDGLATEVKR